MRLGVDFSQFGGPLLPGTVLRWHLLGVRHAVVQYSVRLPQHLEVLKAWLADHPEWEVDVYVYLFWNDLDSWGTPAQRVTRAVKMIRDSGCPVQRIWIDAEDDAGGLSAGALLGLISQGLTAAAVAGFPTGVYTGRWWWIPNTGNSAAFAHLALWDAYYLGQGDPPQVILMPPNFDRWRGYGGWTKPEIWQWHNTTTFGGHSVDLNALEDAAPLVALEEDEMTHVTITAAERGAAQFRSYLVGSTFGGGFASTWVEGQEGFEAAELIAGPLQEIPLAVLRTFNPNPDPLA